MIIFLDIDGVMVSAASWIVLENLQDGFPDFNAKAIVALNKLLQKDTVVVLTTSHRHRFSIDEWKNIFKKRNIDIKNLEILDSKLSKIEAILAYIKSDDFIIIDDDSRMNALPEEFKKHLILTKSLIGLTEEY